MDHLGGGGAEDNHMMAIGEGRCEGGGHGDQVTRVGARTTPAATVAAVALSPGFFARALLSCEVQRER